MEPLTFLESLGYMGLGLVGIFAVTLLIILSIIVLNFFSGDRKGKKKKADEKTDS